MFMLIICAMTSELTMMLTMPSAKLMPTAIRKRTNAPRFLLLLLGFFGFFAGRGGGGAFGFGASRSACFGGGGGGGGGRFFGGGAFSFLPNMLSASLMFLAF